MTLKQLIFSMVFVGLSVIAACSNLPNQPSAQILQQQQQLQKPHTVWKVTQIQGHLLTANELNHQPSLTFDIENKRVSGSDGCNRIFGSYQLQGNVLHLSPLASTKMMCLDSIQMNDQFHLALAQVESFSVEKQVLKLKDQSNHVIMELSPQTP